MWKVKVDCLVCPGMPQSLLQNAEERLPRWYTPGAGDVFCLVKAFVSDVDLCQPPLLVLPGDTIDEISAALHTLAAQTSPCALPQNQKPLLLLFVLHW